MMNQLHTRFTAFILLMLLPTFVLAQAGTSEQTDKLDELFQAWNTVSTPGCAVGVAEEGRTVVSRAWGMADLEHDIRNTPETIFEAGSVSKQFVTATIILLALDGKLSLQDDVRSYIPEMPDYGREITLRHLMNHTSGLRDWGSVAAISGWGRGNRTHNHDHVIDILSRQTRLNFTPGERYSYSNSGYNLLALVVERVTGESFADYSGERIFEPLGMTSTQWRNDYTRIVPGRSSAYSGNEESETFTINRPIEHVHGNGGLLTTVGDLLIWSHAVSSNYFGDEFTRELTKQGVLGSGRTISYASGVQISRDHGQPQIVHTGATGGYRAYLSIYPDQQLSVALLCNVTGANPGRLGSGVSEIFLGDKVMEEKQTEPEGISLSAIDTEAKTGIWKDPRNSRPVEIVLENDTLKVKGGSHLIPLGENRLNLSGSETVYTFITARDSDRPFIRVVREGFEEELLRPVNSAPGNGADLSQFTGRFESRDAETVITIREEDGRLIAGRRPSDEFTLQPVYEDTFIANGFGLIRFIRTGDGRPASFSYSAGRVYDLRFHRIAGR